MYRLYVGNKNYSSWSLRGWLVTKLAGAPFEEVHVPLRGVGPNPANKGFSPSGYVPVLHDGALVVWDSLAIAEYLAERHAGMWPSDPSARAWGRSVASEMHSGFGTLRNEMTMCIRERVEVRPWSDGLAGDIARVEDILNQSRKRHAPAGDFLCGAFSIADCFYAPVAFRFQTYGVPVHGDAERYLRSLLAHPFVQEWEKAALAETTIVEADEPRTLYRDKIAKGSRADA